MLNKKIRQLRIDYCDFMNSTEETIKLKLKNAGFDMNEEIITRNDFLSGKKVFTQCYMEDDTINS
jgi:hypothetical protein